jgi:8-oxo-dGTP pyrophosphatase MutT (NUDIX family)
MHIVYAHETPPYKYSSSLFLAGGSLRKGQEGESWRKDAIQILQDIGYEGVIFVPENRDGKFHEDFNHSEQVVWENKYLDMADCILFWVARDLSSDKQGNLKLPCLTTNVEFGAYYDSGKVILAYPEDAEKMAYMQHQADKHHIHVGHSLTEGIDLALEMLGAGAERSSGECYVPLQLWNTPSFQKWYKAQTQAGNRLEDAKLLYTFRPTHKDIFLWILKVNVYVAKEDRYKVNEFVLSRSDISSVLMWKPNEDPMQSEIVLVREFRSPAATKDGFVHELPSGSSRDDVDPKENACHEVQEETGIVIDPSRLEFHGTKQLAGTLSAHKSHLYSVELTDEEIEWLKSQEGIVHGNKEDSEQTFVEVVRLEEILKEDLTDWTTIGQVMTVVFGMKEVVD